MNKSNEQNIIHAKLQLVEVEKQKLEAERLVHQQKLDVDFNYK